MDSELGELLAVRMLYKAGKTLLRRYLHFRLRQLIPELAIRRPIPPCHPLSRAFTRGVAASHPHNRALSDPTN